MLHELVDMLTQQQQTGCLFSVTGKHVGLPKVVLCEKGFHKCKDGRAAMRFPPWSHHKNAPTTMGTAHSFCCLLPTTHLKTRYHGHASALDNDIVCGVNHVPCDRGMDTVNDQCGGVLVQINGGDKIGTWQLLFSPLTLL